MKLKKRARNARLAGEAHGRAKLSVGAVVNIREQASLGAYQRDLAQRYGVSQSTIWRVIHEKNWIER